ncbi:MAG: hypothetical protein KA142_00975 [Chromatiaceae bacterium]|nr:hypothetical protein [Chromatiaceae bacterium]MBP6806971.1 hypothetical protein [Chromatiaceae bacterium]
MPFLFRHPAVRRQVQQPAGFLLRQGPPLDGIGPKNPARHHLRGQALGDLGQGRRLKAPLGIQHPLMGQLQDLGIQPQLEAKGASPPGSHAAIQAGSDLRQMGEGLDVQRHALGQCEY